MSTRESTKTTTRERQRDLYPKRQQKGGVRPSPLSEGRHAKAQKSPRAGERGVARTRPLTSETTQRPTQIGGISRYCLLHEGETKSQVGSGVSERREEERRVWGAPSRDGREKRVKPFSCADGRRDEGVFWRKKKAREGGGPVAGRREKREREDFIKWGYFKIRAGWDPMGERILEMNGCS